MTLFSLSSISILAGTLAIAVRLPGVLAPATFRSAAIKLPRNVPIGRILMGLVAAIVWWVMYHAATDEWKWAQPLIFIGVPVAYLLVANFGTQYLTLRAVAALLLLIAKQMIDAADASLAPGRLVVTVVAYLWVVTAIWMTVAPHHFRDLLGFLMANDRRCRLACSAGIVVGLALVVLGVFVY
ncbi:MAG: hypothetical protein WCG79_09250 [Verrucomicrobiota bacterium]